MRNSPCVFIFLLWSSLVCAFSVGAQTSIPTLTTSAELEQVVDELTIQNSQLREQLAAQKEQLSDIVNQQSNIAEQKKYVQNALATLDEQGEWLSYSTALGESVRQQLLKLPEKPKLQALDIEIADAKVAQFACHENLTQLDDYPVLAGMLAGDRFASQYRRLIREQKDLNQSLISGYNNVILELTKLKIANSQLATALDNINDAAHRYFFWVADVRPISTLYPIELLKDLYHVFFSVNTLSQLASGIGVILTTPQTLLFLLLALAWVVIYIRMRQRYNDYLSRIAMRVGKVTQDSYTYTLKTVIYSLLMALPIPVLWAVLGYSLQSAWNYPVAVAFGYGMNAAAPILWVFMISAKFASPNGLFIAHFSWSPKRVNSAMKYYRLSLWIVIPLVLLVMSFDAYNNRQFAATVGRFSFILLCFALVFMTNFIHRAHVPLYIDKRGSGDNLFSRILWLFLLSAPWLAIGAACFGYYSTSKVLLGRLEASVIIWFALLLCYFMIRRWMWIQRRRIEFERAKQKRLERMAQRNKHEEEIAEVNEEPVINLDILSAQSLHLVRSIIVMIALISMILLWSELHSAFAFMDKIQLWSANAVVNGVEVSESITLGAVFIAILVMVITVQLVKNLPALLELGVLQHLDLTPGTGYAISTVSKYLILMIGCMVAFSFMGIDWGKIQWLIAALGVGLGFGLQEIFANFISGLIILFEKPIRIGDTVTIRELTGTVTKINTRATTIVDWDRKEIVMPNKAFITEQLVNWSLSDAITRVVLTVPATMDADSEHVIAILKHAAHECSYVLDDPEPQVFLVDIQEGIQLYEIRVFASEMIDRMPLRSEIQQLIISGYHAKGLELPFPPLQTNLEVLGRKSGRRSYHAGTL